MPQITDYYKAGLISKELAEIANPAYEAQGVTLGDILSTETITLGTHKTPAITPTNAILKGLSLFDNLKTLNINNATGLDLDLSELNVSNLRLGVNVTFNSLDISGTKNKINIIALLTDTDDTIHSDSNITIEELKAWPGFATTSSSADTKLEFSLHNGAESKHSTLKMTKVTDGAGNFVAGPITLTTSQQYK